ncbi:MAG: hypothetical protein JST11_17230 [Acidobacteria bacterium]|nr:hypothetical protein [Acidobacteriota bacterium]
MAGSATDTLYQAFLQAAGQQSGDIGEMQYTLQEVIAELNVVQLQQQQAALQAAKAEKTSNSQASSGSSNSSAGSGVLGTVLKSGLGLAPLIGGLVSLFGGGDEPPAPLVKYALPPSVSIDAVESAGQITIASYDQTGMARRFAAAAPAAVEKAGAAGGAQVTVNVQAMDARSFMDRSVEIAAAVRDAMLNLNSINDVVNDL